jgi:hypothetical protein
VLVSGEKSPPAPWQRPGWFTIRTIPSTDIQFGAHVRSVVDGLQMPDPALLEDGLRPAYPLVHVRPRDLAGERELIWYVYRDGRWLPPESAPRRDVE